MKKAWIPIILAVAVSAAAQKPAAATGGKTAGKTSLVDRVGSTGFVQVEADSFNSLTPRQKELAYWLSQASIAIDPIIYDQVSPWGLRQKAILDMIVAHPQGIDPATYKKILDFTKLFWANDGNHNDTTAQKFLPGFTPAELETAAVTALKHTTGATMTEAQLRQELADLRPSLFDPEFEPMITAKSPRGSLDIIQASSNNFYGPGVTLDALKDFQEKNALNSRVVKGRDGTLMEEVYRAGTPDGTVKPGLYAEYLQKAIGYLQKARAVAEPGQAEVIDNLIRFYQTGDFADWIKWGGSWVPNNTKVDFVNGFVEVYRDARGAKGTSQSFVSVTDEKMDSMMKKIAANAQYFEGKAPWAEMYKKQGVKPPEAKAIETVVETGDFGVTTVGDNLPNEDEIHQKYGTKSFMFTGSTRALNRARGAKANAEFAWDENQRAITAKYGDEASDLMTALHEIIGHGSGKLNPKLDHDYAYYLKEYASTLEEARADLMGLWNVSDPKLKELGVISDQPNVMKAMYYQAANAPLVQLRANPTGETLEEDHQRDRQLIVNYIMDKTGGVELAEKDGKHYMRVTDFDKMRQGVGMLLAELMRIKAEGDYDAIKSLIDKYGVHFDPKLRDEVVARYKALDIPTYWMGVNADLNPSFDANGNVKSVTMSYPRDVVKQQLAYAAMYHPELLSGSGQKATITLTTPGAATTHPRTTKD